MKEQKRKQNNSSPAPVLPKQITLEDVKNEKIEMPIIYDGIMLGFLTTDFKREDFNNIFDNIKDLPYPILVDKKTNMPLLDGKNEAIYDYTDWEISTYNKKQKKRRVIAMLKLFGQGFEWSDNEDEDIQILDELPAEIYNLLEIKINEIIKAKFVLLEQKKQNMLRYLIAASAIEGKMQKRNTDKIKDEINKLLNEIKLLRNIYNKTANEEERKEIEKKVKIKEEEIDSLNSKLPRRKDDISFKHGIKHTGMIISCSKEFSWGKELTMGYLNNRLSEEDKLYCDLCLANYQLNGEYENDVHKELEAKHNRDKNNKEGRN